jgi:Type I restriction modification DNA specificity domain
MVADSNDDPLPPGWTAARVGRVGSVRLGRQRSPDKHTGQFSTKYLRAANITREGLDLTNVLEMDFTPTEREVFGLRHGDVVLAEASGSAAQVGRAAVWRSELSDCCYQNTVIRFRPHAVHSKFALLIFRHHAVTGVFAEAAHGVGIQHLGGTRFAGLPFPLPPLPEQERICVEAERRLSDLRESEDLLRTTLARIHEQSREIIAAAVKGELAAQEDAHPIMAMKTAATPGQGSLFDIDQKPSVIIVDSEPPLPRGWVWRRIADVGDVTIGRQRSPQHHQGQHMRPYLRVANVFEDRIDISDILLMNFTPDEYGTYRLEPGDILLNEGQSPELVGRSAIYRNEIPDVCFQNTLLRFRARPEVDPEYAQLVFRHYLHAGEFRKNAHWSTNIAHLGLERFVVMPFPLPPLAEQQKIVAEARTRLDASVAQDAAVRASLARIPDMEREILSAAVAGKLVPQDEAEESASALLARLGEPPTVDPIPLTQEESTMPTKGSPPTRRTAPTAHLDQVLREAGRPLSLPELFSLAGYDRDSPEHIELFYLALRTERDSSIRTISSDGKENAVMEVIPDAP